MGLTKKPDKARIKEALKGFPFLMIRFRGM
jgi:hypothetical protein